MKFSLQAGLRSLTVLASLYVFLGIIVFPATATASLGDGLIAHYPFNGNASDESGNGRHGVVMGAYPATDRFGRSQSAYGFNGNGRIIVDAFRGHTWGQNFTVSVWFQRTGQWWNYQGIVNNGYYTNGSWEIRMGRENEGTLLGGGVLTTADPRPWDFSTYASQNTWHHVVMTYDGSSLAFYLDGAVVGIQRRDSGNILTRNTPLTIGQAGPGTVNEYFHGFIDDIRIYGRALSADEVGMLHREGLDADGDGISDGEDNCPTTPNGDQSDSDVDGLGDACDTCPLDMANDADGDGLCADADNCPMAANADQRDSDADGLGDACDACPLDMANDADGDGLCADEDPCPLDAGNDADGDTICAAVDVCPGTSMPEAHVPTERHGTNRWVLGPDGDFTIEETAGCNCEQIIEQLELEEGHRKHGCSIGAMDDWTALVASGAVPTTSAPALNHGTGPSRKDTGVASSSPMANGCSAGGGQAGGGTAMGLMLLLFVATRRFARARHAPIRARTSNRHWR